MSTIDSKSIINTMLKNNGIYPGDPQVFAIYEYKNAHNNNATWKLCYDENREKDFLLNGHYKGIPIALFRANKLTEAGEKWLRNGKRN